MKSYNHLWEKFISNENYEVALKKALKGKRDRRQVKRYLEDPDFKEKVMGYAKNFHNMKHKPVQIYDGIQRKKRTIIVPSFPEQVVHHMAVNVLVPIFMHGMYEHSYGSIPRRGAHMGMKMVKKWIRHGGKDCKYCLKMDIRRYFESIPHEILIRHLQDIIHDARFMALLQEIINVVPHGIPLGFYSSQWLANWYLQGLDHYIKEDLKAKYYIRYMDDMVIFGGSKRKLHLMRKKVSKYLENVLGLKLKENWQVFLFDYTDRYGNSKGRFLDFMGFRFYRNRVTLRKGIMIKATRKAKKLSNEKKKTVHSIRQMLSYFGWLSCTDSYGVYENYIKPNVNFQYLRRRMSRHDRRQNRRTYGMAQSAKHAKTAGR